MTRLPYLPLGLDRLGEELHVLELGGGAEGLHALGGPEEPLQQVRVQGPQSLLGETTRPFYWATRNENFDMDPIDKTVLM